MKRCFFTMCNARVAVVLTVLAITARGAEAAEPPKSEKTAEIATDHAGGPIT
jgi:hypothetical protein